MLLLPYWNTNFDIANYIEMCIIPVQLAANSNAVFEDQSRLTFKLWQFVLVESVNYWKSQCSKAFLFKITNISLYSFTHIYDFDEYFFLTIKTVRQKSRANINKSANAENYKIKNRHSELSTVDVEDIFSKSQQN